MELMKGTFGEQYDEGEAVSVLECEKGYKLGGVTDCGRAVTLF